MLTPKTISCENSWLGILLLLPASTRSLSSLQLNSLKELTLLVSNFSTTPGSHCSDFCPYTLVLPFLELHISEVIQNTFSFWSLPLNMLFWRLIYVVCQWCAPFYH